MPGSKPHRRLFHHPPTCLFHKYVLSTKVGPRATVMDEAGLAFPFAGDNPGSLLEVTQGSSHPSKSKLNSMNFKARPDVWLLVLCRQTQMQWLNSPVSARDSSTPSTGPVPHPQGFPQPVTYHEKTCSQTHSLPPLPSKTLWRRKSLQEQVPSAHAVRRELYTRCARE